MLLIITSVLSMILVTVLSVMGIIIFCLMRKMKRVSSSLADVILSEFKSIGQIQYDWRH